MLLREVFFGENGEEVGIVTRRSLHCCFVPSAHCIGSESGDVGKRWWEMLPRVLVLRKWNCGSHEIGLAVASIGGILSTPAMSSSSSSSFHVREVFRR